MHHEATASGSQATAVLPSISVARERLMSLRVRPSRVNRAITPPRTVQLGAFCAELAYEHVDRSPSLSANIWAPFTPQNRHTFALTLDDAETDGRSPWFIDNTWHLTARGVERLIDSLVTLNIVAPRPVVLIACCGLKAPSASKARDLYRSPLFRKSVGYADRRGLAWAVLSAAHGLVMPDDVVSPYDVTLTAMCVAARRSWASATRDAINQAFPNAGFIVLAGANYRAAVPANRPTEVPMKGMGIGQQLSFLTRDENAATEPS